MGSCKETFRIQLGRLLAHILSPAHTVQERKQIFEIVHEPAHQDILRDCLSPSPQVSILAFDKAFQIPTYFQDLDVL